MKKEYIQPAVHVITMHGGNVLLFYSVTEYPNEDSSDVGDSEES